MKVRKIGRVRVAAVAVIAVVASVAVLSAGPASAAHPTTYAPQKCSKPKVRPSLIILTCADAKLGVKMKHWTHWNGHNGAGKGVVFANTCDPDCASGGWRYYPAKVKVTKPRKRTCNGRKGLRMFTRIKFDWRGPAPPSSVPSKYGLFCNP